MRAHQRVHLKIQKKTMMMRIKGKNLEVLNKVDLKELIPELDNLAAISLSDVPVGWTVMVTTENSNYEITVLDPKMAKVSVKGGYFDKRDKSNITTVIGSTFGGSSVVQSMIVEGLFMEFGNRVTTSKVKDFKLISPTGSAEV